MEVFYLDQYVEEKLVPNREQGIPFHRLCEKVREAFLREWDDSRRDLHAVLELQKRAIIGYDQEKAYFKEKILSYVEQFGLSRSEYPTWYESLEDAIYQEVWGLAGTSEWFTEPYRDSSSAKIIGDRIYFMKNGTMQLMPQRINQERREQLIRAFLLLAPQERLDREFHEVYLLDGTRITVFREPMAKRGQDAIVFRRYLIPNYTFEEQADRGTIPKEAIPLFRSMVKIGYNVAFVGAVRTAKTTFLSTWQSYEDDALEGVMVETDPEIPMDRLCPKAPVIQLIADDEKLRKIAKNLLRSDADYFILAEARDGNALDTAIRIASKGARRMKITFHCRDPLQFSYDVAWEIANERGGEVSLLANRVAMSFDYVFHFVQENRKNQKRLNSIYELSLDTKQNAISMQQICKFDSHQGSWLWRYSITEGKRTVGQEASPQGFAEFQASLRQLSQRFPMEKCKEEGLQ